MDRTLAPLSCLAATSLVSLIWLLPPPQSRGSGDVEAVAGVRSLEDCTVGCSVAGTGPELVRALVPSVEAPEDREVLLVHLSDAARMLTTGTEFALVTEAQQGEPWQLVECGSLARGTEVVAFHAWALDAAEGAELYLRLGRQGPVVHRFTTSEIESGVAKVELPARGAVRVELSLSDEDRVLAREAPFVVDLEPVDHPVSGWLTAFTECAAGGLVVPDVPVGMRFRVSLSMPRPWYVEPSQLEIEGPARAGEAREIRARARFARDVEGLFCGTWRGTSLPPWGRRHTEPTGVPARHLVAEGVVLDALGHPAAFGTVVATVGDLTIADTSCDAQGRFRLEDLEARTADVLLHCVWNGSEGPLSTVPFGSSGHRLRSGAERVLHGRLLTGTSAESGHLVLEVVRDDRDDTEATLALARFDGGHFAVSGTESRTWSLQLRGSHDATAIPVARALQLPAFGHAGSPALALDARGRLHRFALTVLSATGAVPERVTVQAEDEATGAKGCAEQSRVGRVVLWSVHPALRVNIAGTDRASATVTLREPDTTVHLDPELPSGK